MNFLTLEEYAEWAKKERIVIDIYDKPCVHDHAHDFLELSYVMDGCANHTLEGASSVLSKGDYFIVDYNKRHKYTQIGDRPFTIINCLFVPQLIDETLKGCCQLKEVVNNYLIKFDFCRLKDHPTKFIYHDDDGHIGQLFARLCEEYQQKHMGYLETMRCYLILILIDIMRQIQVPSPTETDNEMVRYITCYVEQNFMEKLSLTELTQDYNYSLAHISHTFKMETGMTFQDYVQSVRIRESCRLLINTSKKVADIATLVGYTNIKFFNQVFKRQTGMTPRQFRLARHPVL